MIPLVELTTTMLLASQLSAGAIVAHAKQVDLAIKDLSAKVDMTIAREGEPEKRRVFRLLMRREGVNYRARITLLEPPEMKDTRFLVVASRGQRNQQWAYFPDLELVRQIASRDQDAPFLGSDITYADLAGGAHLDDLVHSLIGEEEIGGVPCYVLEGVPRHEIVYGKLRGWVRKDNFVTVRAVFFDREGARMKEARMTDVQTVDGVPFAHRIEMQSFVAKSRTVLTITETRVNLGLSPDLFNKESLAKSGH